VGAQSGYCPGCFALIDAGAERCPACGLDLARFGARDYRDKLRAALLHPLAEVRRRAIISIGWRRESEAAPSLVDCALRHPTDVVEGLQVVESLGANAGFAAGRAGIAHARRDAPRTRGPVGCSAQAWGLTNPKARA
jgi:hypothetical protein